MKNINCDKKEKNKSNSCGTKRVYKKDSTGITTYFFDTIGGIEDVILEYDEKGQLKARYTIGGKIDEILKKKYKTEEGWKGIYYHYDGLGNLRILTDEKGRVIGSYEYEPFGRIIEAEGGESKKNTITYTAREYDRESGLNYNRARYYDTRIGRFTTVDPIIRQPSTISPPSLALSSFSSGCPTCGGARTSNYSSFIPTSFSFTPSVFTHPYVYCRNNPVNLVDPNGLATEGQRCCPTPGTPKYTANTYTVYRRIYRYTITFVAENIRNIDGGTTTEVKTYWWTCWMGEMREPPGEEGTQYTGTFNPRGYGYERGARVIVSIFTIKYLWCNPETKRWEKKTDRVGGPNCWFHPGFLVLDDYWECSK